MAHVPLLERLASGGFASSSSAFQRPSTSLRDQQPARLTYSARNASKAGFFSSKQIQMALRVSRPRLQALATGAPLSEVLSLCLETTDYSFYQRMKDGEITESYLWEKRLAPLLDYLAPEEVRRVREALSLAYDAHALQRRKSGEPFITHPVEVTRILAELQMDWESLAAGLLHDTVEDCGDAVGLEEIAFHFGPAVCRIVEGETKFSKLPTHHPERETAMVDPADSSDPKAQDLQFLFLAMTEEVRIIVVKLADRLHNMRTMAAMPPGKQRRIAQETLTVFAPLARLLGLYTIKEELEELSFKYAMPQQHAVMKKTVERLWEQQSPAVNAAALELQHFLAEDTFLASRLRGIHVQVAKKALYGVWRKLQDTNKSVRDVSEIAQLQVVLDPAAKETQDVINSSNGVSRNGVSGNDASDRQLCYHVMGVIHSYWAPIPGSMKDYIATPKPNNYQSLHTTVVPTGLARVEDANVSTASDNGGRPKWRGARGNASLFPIEVQIRTAEMERLARFGIAVESWSCADYVRSPQYQSPTSQSNRTNNVKPNGTSPNGKRGLSSGGGGLSFGWLPFGFGLLGGKREDGSSTSSDDSDGSPSVNAGARVNGTVVSSIPASSNGGRLDPKTMSRRINWLNSIRVWQEEFVGTLTAQEFVACVTDDLLGQGVFVFTPSGQVMRLPKGATVVDFAYHIHTDVGNTMVAAKVNGKIVPADHALANAEVVEVITYKGPVNATIIKRHQRWLAAARTKTARHKIAKFLREHAALAVAAGLFAPLDTALGSAQRGGAGGSNGSYDPGAPQVVWLLARCDDRQGLLADIANVIARHGHNIRSYSGSVDRDAALFIMEYELEGCAEALGALCEELSQVPSVQGWSVGCALPRGGRGVSRI